MHSLLLLLLLHKWSGSWWLQMIAGWHLSDSTCKCCHSVCSSAVLKLRSRWHPKQQDCTAHPVLHGLPCRTTWPPAACHGACDGDGAVVIPLQDRPAPCAATGLLGSCGDACVALQPLRMHPWRLQLGPETPCRCGALDAAPACCYEPDAAVPGPSASAAPLPGAFSWKAPLKLRRQPGIRQSYFKDAKERKQLQLLCRVRSAHILSCTFPAMS